MISWGCCVLTHHCSGEPTVRSDEPRLPRTDVFDSEFEVGAPTSKEVEKNKSRPKRAAKNPLTAVLESWLLSILHCRFLVRSEALFLYFCRQCRNYSGSFRKRSFFDRRGNCWTVEEASRSFYQESGTIGWGPQHEVPGAFHKRGQSRELLEQAFDDGNICVQTKNLIVLFLVDSRILTLFVPFRPVGHRSCCHCFSCCWSSDGVLVSLRVCQEENAKLLSPLTNS